VLEDLHRLSSSLTSGRLFPSTQSYRKLTVGEHVVAFHYTLDRSMKRPTFGGEIILMLD
jgi:hypothetical protein